MSKSKDKILIMGKIMINKMMIMTNIVLIIITITVLVVIFVVDGPIIL